MTEYGFHPEALADLDEIWEFIRADNLDSADRAIDEIISAIRGLVASPIRGHRRPDLTSRPLRFILVREYLIAYAPDKSRFGLLPSSMEGAARALWPRFSGAESEERYGI